MNSALFVHIPAHLLASRLNFLLSRRLQPEVACQEISIDQLNFLTLGTCTAALSQAQLKTTLHAPFAGFSPGSGRRRVRNMARELAQKSLQLAKTIQAKKIIFHPGLPPGCSANQQSQWLQHNLEFWPEFIAMAEAIDCCICMENIYETTPDLFLQLCQTLASDRFGHCFDIGHWNIFGSIKLESWLEQMSPWLKHLHLHDNCGDQDQHLPIGHGNARFSSLFCWLKENDCAPTYTLEAHNPSDLDISLEAMEQFLS